MRVVARRRERPLGRRRRFVDDGPAVRVRDDRAVAVLSFELLQGLRDGGVVDLRCRARAGPRWRLRMTSRMQQRHRECNEQ
jgi:hypothetical protein